MTQVNAPAPVTRVLRTVKTMGQGARRRSCWSST